MSISAKLQAKETSWAFGVRLVYSKETYNIKVHFATRERNLG